MSSKIIKLNPYSSKQCFALDASNVLYAVDYDDLTKKTEIMKDVVMFDSDMCDVCNNIITVCKSDMKWYDIDVTSKTITKEYPPDVTYVKHINDNTYIVKKATSTFIVGYITTNGNFETLCNAPMQTSNLIDTPMVVNVDISNNRIMVYFEHDNVVVFSYDEDNNAILDDGKHIVIENHAIINSKDRVLQLWECSCGSIRNVVTSLRIELIRNENITIVDYMRTYIHGDASITVKNSYFNRKVLCYFRCHDNIIVSSNDEVHRLQIHHDEYIPQFSYKTDYIKKLSVMVDTDNFVRINQRVQPNYTTNDFTTLSKKTDPAMNALGGFAYVSSPGVLVTTSLYGGWVYNEKRDVDVSVYNKYTSKGEFHEIWLYRKEYIAMFGNVGVDIYTKNQGVIYKTHDDSPWIKFNFPAQFIIGRTIISDNESLNDTSSEYVVLKVYNEIYNIRNANVAKYITKTKVTKALNIVNNFPDAFMKSYIPRKSHIAVVQGPNNDVVILKHAPSKKSSCDDVSTIWYQTDGLSEIGYNRKTKTLVIPDFKDAEITHGFLKHVPYPVGRVTTPYDVDTIKFLKFNVPYNVVSPSVTINENATIEVKNAMITVKMNMHPSLTKIFGIRGDYTMSNDASSGECTLTRVNNGSLSFNHECQFLDTLLFKKKLSGSIVIKSNDVVNVIIKENDNPTYKITLQTNTSKLIYDFSKSGGEYIVMSNEKGKCIVTKKN